MLPKLSDKALVTKAIRMLPNNFYLHNFRYVQVKKQFVFQKTEGLGDRLEIYDLFLALKQFLIGEPCVHTYVVENFLQS